MRKVIAAITAIEVIALAGLVIWYFTNSSTTSSKTMESIIIGEPALEQSALIYIAENQGYFARNGLNVTLRGKKVGLPKKTICEFFLGRFLNLHGMGLQDVSLVDTPTSQSVEAAVNGSLDAIIYYQPYVYAIENQLGDNGTIWQAQNNQLLYGVMCCRKDWATTHPEQINRLLKSLALAEEYFIDHPNEAKAIVQERLNFSDSYMATVWPDHQFSLTLDQSLLIAMNDEGRWMINNNLTTEKTLPYFRDYIYTKGLEEIKPESVNIR